ncbi:MAG: hypothetical protein K1X61_05590 [Chitinophagales bacterium]|nr:hypothetical protein [Chitinophagales bacterium]
MNENATGTAWLTHLYPHPVYLATEPATPSLLNLNRQPVEYPVLLLVLKNAFNQEIAESDFVLLRKLTEWLGVANDKVAWHLMAEATIAFNDLKLKYKVENIICYGATPADLGLNMDYQLNRTIQFLGCNILFTSSFAEVQKNEAMKKLFFEQVKLFFSHLKNGSH